MDGCHKQEIPQNLPGFSSGCHTEPSGCSRHSRDLAAAAETPHARSSSVPLPLPGPQPHTCHGASGKTGDCGERGEGLPWNPGPPGPVQPAPGPRLVLYPFLSLAGVGVALCRSGLGSGETKSAKTDGGVSSWSPQVTGGHRPVWRERLGRPLPASACLSVRRILPSF